MKISGITEDIEFVSKYTISNIQSSIIKPSPIHGFGLFAIEDIPVDAILGRLDGQRMGWDSYHELHQRIKGEIESCEQYFFMEWNLLDIDTLLVRPFRTKYSYINHSREPNLKLDQASLSVFARREIKAEEELTLDYRDEPLPEKYKMGYGRSFL